jgi:hypothetical protein
VFTIERGFDKPLRNAICRSSPNPVAHKAQGIVEGRCFSSKGAGLPRRKSADVRAVDRKWGQLLSPKDASVVEVKDDRKARAAAGKVWAMKPSWVEDDKIAW